MREPQGNILLYTILCESFLFVQFINSVSDMETYGELVDDTKCTVIAGFSFYLWHLAWNYFT